MYKKLVVLSALLWVEQAYAQSAIGIVQLPRDAKTTSAIASERADAINIAISPHFPLEILKSIRVQIARCWDLPEEAKKLKETEIMLRLKLAEDGRVTHIELAGDNKERYRTDINFRAVADSAIHAVYLCSPLQNLPLEKYSDWQDMELTFVPNLMLF